MTNQHGGVGSSADGRSRLRVIGRRRRFRRGESLMTEGAPSDGVLLVESGTVKAVISAANGAESILGTYGAGALLGESGMLHGRPRSATVIALDRVEVTAVADSTFIALHAQDPAVRTLVHETLHQRLLNADRRQLSFASQDVCTRVARQILQWGQDWGRPFGKSIVITRFSQRELAQCVAASAKTVEDALSSLRASGTLRTSRRRFEITDVEKFREHLEGLAENR